ncbi:hypothetical protein [Niveibacterium terrae]|uniref:hypothetical protein n=1 Tax=Niveibacterium terrae TaxID=3373598 RepID=UPI003A9422A4
MTWGDEAWVVMDKTRIQGVMDGKTPDQIAKDIDAAYPFGKRSMWPYKAWLTARKEFFAKHGLPRRVPKTPNGDLFEQGEAA